MSTGNAGVQGKSGTHAIGLIVILLGGGAAIFVHGAWIYVVVGITAVIAVLLVLAGLRIAKGGAPSQEVKRKLRASLDAQGFTKEVRAQQRRSGRFGLTVLLGMFLFIGVFFASTYFLIQHRVSFSIRLAIDAVIFLAIIPLSMALSNVIAKWLSALVKPLDEWFD